mgnify:CR=1 FL=1
MRKQVLAFVMAGGKGTRLEPLTEARSKPAVPFGGKYRIADFVLSNLINSGIYGIYVLTQFKSQSLTEHMNETWNFGSILPGHFIVAVPAQQRTGAHWYKGTADAIYQNLNLIVDKQPDLVAVFGADHIYRMDVRQMVRYHCEREADASVAALPVPIGQASSFGVIETDAEGRIIGFQEKPQQPKPIPGDPGRAYASMGNYLFRADVLREALQEANRRGETDFGHHVLPRLSRTHRVYAYDFSTNEVPGTKPY